ncbi:MAG: hypothetical protein IK008_01185 [Bacteroidales bacterium]|nr:hypothetical protein [Bacteroidales bacterium]
MRKFVLCFLTLPCALVLRAQDERIVRAALLLSGASCEEEIPSEWIEQLEDVRAIRVNSPYLRAGILLSDYQVASIKDYRSRHGDILSAEELSLVDGFSLEGVRVLEPFLLFDSARLPGNVDTVKVHGSALIRSTRATLGAKAKASGESWRAGGAWRGEDWTVYADGSFRRWRVLAGDFHTRWGQGLAGWTGFSMESLSTLDAFSRKASGLTPSGSYSGDYSLRGAALEYDAGRFRVSAYAGESALGAHADYIWRHGQLGVTYASGTVSMDGKWNIRGLDLAGEMAVRHAAFAGKIALSGKMGERWRWAAQGRGLPSGFSGRNNGEYALAGGIQFRNHYGADTPGHEASLTLDCASLPVPGSDPGRFQLRGYGIWKWQITPAWLLDVRLTERYRNYEAPRTDFRTDLKYVGSPWLSALRLEAVRCEKWGVLSYIEGGYKGPKSAVYLRATGFSVQAWAARIYCYERDAPGTFSVPAYNGRGVALSLTASHKKRMGCFTLKGHLRAACTIREGYHPAPVLNLQLQGDW